MGAQIGPLNYTAQPFILPLVDVVRMAVWSDCLPRILIIESGVFLGSILTESILSLLCR